MGKSAELARRYAVWPVVAFLLLTGEVCAQSSPEDELRDLSDKIWLVQSLSRDFPDGAFWRTWGPLRDDAVAALERYPGHPGLTDLKNGILLQWGNLLVTKGEPEEGKKQLEPLLPPEVDEKWRLPAANALARISEAEALAAAGRTAKIGHYREAEVLYVQGRSQEEFLRVKAIRIGLQAEEGLEAYRAGLYDRALELLSQLEKEEDGELPPGEPADALRDVRTGTGILRLEPFAVTVDATPVGDGGRVRLTPVGAGEEWTGAAREKLRRRAGLYRFEFFAGDGTDAVVLNSVTISADAPASVQVPDKVRDGMVFVRAAPEHGVLRPFFIDRTEVTVGQYRAFDRSYRPRHAGDDLPAHGITFEQAVAYAKEVGKSLPTKEQWLWAAFEGSSRPFPWEGTAAAGWCNEPGSGKPTPVGSYPKGASPFGVLDMVGNVWEWLDLEAAIGGGFRAGATLAYYRGTDFDPLRDEKPSESKYASFDDERKAKYRLYQVIWKQPGKENVVEVGLRCVLGL